MLLGLCIINFKDKTGVYWISLWSHDHTSTIKTDLSGRPIEVVTTETIE